MRWCIRSCVVCVDKRVAEQDKWRCRRHNQKQAVASWCEPLFFHFCMFCSQLSNKVESRTQWRQIKKKNSRRQSDGALMIYGIDFMQIRIGHRSDDCFIYIFCSPAVSFTWTPRQIDIFGRWTVMSRLCRLRLTNRCEQCGRRHWTYRIWQRRQMHLVNVWANQFLTRKEPRLDSPNRRTAAQYNNVVVARSDMHNSMVLDKMRNKWRIFVCHEKLHLQLAIDHQPLLSIYRRTSTFVIMPICSHNNVVRVHFTTQTLRILPRFQRTILFFFFFCVFPNRNIIADDISESSNWHYHFFFACGFFELFHMKIYIFPSCSRADFGFVQFAVAETKLSLYVVYGGENIYDYYYCYYYEYDCFEADCWVFCGWLLKRGYW